MEKQDIIKSLVTAVLTAAVGLAFQYIDPPTILTEIWQRVFVGPWFLWFSAFGVGVYWFACFLMRLHRTTVDTLKAVQQESGSRVAAIDSLSNRLNALETRFQKDLENGLFSLKGQLGGVIKNEAHDRNESLHALSRELEKHFERMNSIETSLPNRILGRIQEIENQLSAQISNLRQQMEKPVPAGLVNSETATGLGLLKPFPTEGRPGLVNTPLSGSTPKEKVAEALLEQKRKTKP